eukprot:evm.model.NODE_40553_length_18732_cov_22.576180.3
MTASHEIGLLMGAPGFWRVEREDDDSEEEEEEESGEEDEDYEENDWEAIRVFMLRRKQRRAKRRREQEEEEEEEGGKADEGEEDRMGGGAQKATSKGKRRVTHIDVWNDYTNGVEEKKKRERLRKKNEDEERTREQQQREQLYLEQVHAPLVPNGPPEIKLSTSDTSITDVCHEWFSRSAVGDGKPLQYYFLLALCSKQAHRGRRCQDPEIPGPASPPYVLGHCLQGKLLGLGISVLDVPVVNIVQGLALPAWRRKEEIVLHQLAVPDSWPTEPLTADVSDGDDASGSGIGCDGCWSFPLSLPPSLPPSFLSPSLIFSLFSSPKKSDNKRLINEEMLLEALLALFLKWTLIPPSFPPSLPPSLQAGMFVKVSSTKNHRHEEGALKALLAKRVVGSQRGEGLQQVQATDPDVVTVAMIDTVRTVQSYTMMKLGEALFSTLAVCTYIRDEVEQAREKGTLGKGVLGNIVSLYETTVRTLEVAEGGGHV